jgi:hypothetical protein
MGNNRRIRADSRQLATAKFKTGIAGGSPSFTLFGTLFMASSNGRFGVGYNSHSSSVCWFLDCVVDYD